VIGKGAKPYLVGYTANKEIAQINQQIAHEKARQKDLSKQIGYLQTPAGMESEARKLGWVKEGEVAVVVDDRDPPVLAGELVGDLTRAVAASVVDHEDPPVEPGHLRERADRLGDRLGDQLLLVVGEEGHAQARPRFTAHR
jgi:hypothetical protein